MNGKTKDKARVRKVTTGSISSELLRKVNLIAAYRRLSNSDALDKYGGPGVDKEYRKVLEDSHRELGEAGA